MDERFSEQDMRDNRTCAGLGYLFFFVPLMQCGDSKLGRYCANQGLIATVLIVVVSIFFKILSVIPFIGWLFRVAGGIAGLAILLLQILCFAQLMTNGKVTELPYIGSWHLLSGLDEPEGGADEW